MFPGWKVVEELGLKYLPADRFSGAGGGDEGEAPLSKFDLRRDSGFKGAVCCFCFTKRAHICLSSME